MGSLESHRVNCLKVGLTVTFILALVFILASLLLADYSEVYRVPKLSRANSSLLTTLGYPHTTLGVDQHKMCPLNTSTVGLTTVDTRVLNFDALNKKYSAFASGGHFKPNCTSHNKTAIIVAYRDREKHLKILLNNLIPFLVKQQSEFVIFVVELVQPLIFNRALLMNVGFVEALKTMNFTCFFFHDVDLIPVHDRNFYRCSNQPRHMSVGNSKFKYRLPYSSYAGGVIGMSRFTYQSINGQSNLFFGWGGEDDDTASRLRKAGYTVMRRSMLVGRYEALGHKKDKGNPNNPKRGDLARKKSKKPPSEEGLSTLKYKIVKKEKRPLFTWILVDLDMKYYKKAIDAILHDA